MQTVLAPVKSLGGLLFSSLGVQDWLWTVAKEGCNPSHDYLRSRSQDQDLEAQMSVSPTSYLGGLELSIGPFRDLQGYREECFLDQQYYLWSVAEGLEPSIGSF